MYDIIVHDILAARRGGELHARLAVLAETRFGPYIVHELLGTGGMASVHLAETQSAGGFRKRVALKRLLAHLSEEPELVDAFAREAKLASHLHHQHIAQTFDLGVIEGTYYIAMELVPGPTLRQIVRQARTLQARSRPSMRSTSRCRSPTRSSTRTTCATTTARRSRSCTATCRRQTSSSPAPAS